MLSFSFNTEKATIDDETEAEARIISMVAGTGSNYISIHILGVMCKWKIVPPYDTLCTLMTLSALMTLCGHLCPVSHSTIIGWMCVLESVMYD